MNQTNTATGTIGAVGALTSYAAYLAQTKYGVPMEVGAPVVGAILAFFGRWAAKLDPSK